MKSLSNLQIAAVLTAAEILPQSALKHLMGGCGGSGMKCRYCVEGENGGAASCGSWTGGCLSGTVSECESSCTETAKKTEPDFFCECE